MNSIYYFFNFIIGTCLASHALVIYERWPERNIIFARSHCDNCKFELSLLDEIPLFSFLVLRGRCKYCQSSIPAELFLFELIGGIAFTTIDFSNKNGILTSILLFSLLLVTISDYNQQNFDLLFLVPATLIAIFYNQFPNYNLIDWISFICIISILGWNAFKQKMGSGDLIIYLIISSYFSTTVANFTLLIASLLAIIVFLIERNDKNQSFPFLPFIFTGLAFTQFLV